MTDDVIALARRDGTAEFDCTGCGIHVHRFGGGNGPALCAICQAGLVQDEDGKISLKEEAQPAATD